MSQNPKTPVFLLTSSKGVLDLKIRFEFINKMEGKDGKSGGKLTTKEEVKFTTKDFISENMGKFKDYYKLVSRLGSGNLASLSGAFG